jgi:hypothetical protein
VKEINVGLEKFNKNEILYEAKINKYIKEIFIPKFAKNFDMKDVFVEKKNLRRTVFFLKHNFWIEFDFLASENELKVASGYRSFEMGKTNFYQTLIYYPTLEESIENLTSEITKFTLKKIFVNNY